MAKVGINLLWLVPGVVGGSETYTTRLLHGLVERSSELDYTLFALASVRRGPLRAGQVVQDRIRTGNGALEVVSRRGRELVARRPVPHGATSISCITREGPFRCSASGPAGADDPRPSIPLLSRVLHQGEAHYLKSMVPRSAEAARLVLTPSEFSRRTVIERLNIDPSIVVVVPHGISPRTIKRLEPMSASDTGSPDASSCIPAITYPHKNHLVLIEAFAKVLEDFPDTMLVLTGAKGSMEVRDREGGRQARHQ